MKRNQAGQKVRVRAFDANGKVSGIAGSLSMQIDIDGGGLAALTDPSAVEVGTSGIYEFDLSQAESDGHELFFVPSGPANVELVCLPDCVVYTDRTDDILGDGFVRANHSLATRTTNLIVPRSVAESIVAPEDTIVVYRGAEWKDEIDGVADISGATAIYYALKEADVDDDNALLRVKKNLGVGTGNEGLLRINKQAAANAAHASIAQTTYTVGGETFYKFTATIKGEASAQIPVTLQLLASINTGFTRSTETNGWVSEWKLVGENDQVLKQGRVRVRPDITRLTS